MSFADRMREGEGDDGVILDWTPRPATGERHAGPRHSILAAIEHLHGKLETARAEAIQRHRDESARHLMEEESVAPPAEMGATGEPVVPGDAAHRKDLTKKSQARPASRIAVTPTPPPAPLPKPRRKRRLVKQPKPRAPEVSATPVYDTHAFQDGWCTRCGISSGVARDNGYACDPVDSTTPSPATERKSTGPSGTHRFNGNWCIRCGLSRDQASKFTCND